jgi:hypothetical protein
MPDFIVKNKSRLFLWILISFMTLATMGQALYANVRLNERVDTLNELNVLLNCIEHANRTIQMASLATNQHDREDQLRSRKEITPLADLAIQKLLKQHLGKKEKKILIELIDQRNTVYRYTQNVAVFAIANDSSDVIIWKLMADYRDQQLSYISKIKNIHDIVVDDIRAKYRWMLWYIIIVIFTGVLAADTYMTMLSRKIRELKYKNRQKNNSTKEITV